MIDDTVNSAGVIRDVVEVMLFGRWLLQDGKPGLALVRGKPADEMVVLKTVAVAAAEIFARQRAESFGKLPAVVRSDHITRTHLRDRWTGMFAGDHTASDFRSRLPTARRYLSAYFDHLATQRCGKDNKRMRSKHLEKVLRAMSKSVSSK